jgi:hypothetical protein
MTHFEKMAAAARPIDDDDWGSDRQIEAENAFFGACPHDADGNVFSEDFENYCLKATTDEMIDEALRLWRRIELLPPTRPAA